MKNLLFAVTCFVLCSNFTSNKSVEYNEQHEKVKHIKLFDTDPCNDFYDQQVNQVNAFYSQTLYYVITQANFPGLSDDVIEAWDNSLKDIEKDRKKNCD